MPRASGASFAEREAAEYSGRSNQLGSLFDAEVPKAILTLDRVLKTLEAYQSLRAPSGADALSAGSSVGSEAVTAARPAPTATIGAAAASGEQKPAAAGQSAPGGQAIAADSEHTTESPGNSVAGNGGGPSTAAGS